MTRLYAKSQIEILKRGGKILASILNQLKEETREGKTGIDLNKKAEELIQKSGALPAFLQYHGFPASLCVSVNDGLVHGVPSKRKFQRGDLVSLDLGIRYKGLCVDKAISFYVGEMSREKEKFLNTIKSALDLGIERAKVGHKLGEISAIIEKTIKNAGYGLVTVLFGHGIGKDVHEDPKVPNFGKETDGPTLQEGMVLAIEPMACMGKGEVKIGKDGFTFVSVDGSFCAHFEDTIALTKNGPIILTRL